MPLFADVAVPVPLAKAFTYEVPRSMAAALRPGSRVLCPFGARRMLGVVLAIEEREPPPGARRMKALSAIVDAEPALPAELLAFVRELADYYLAPIGEALRLALPAIERGQVRGIRPEGELFALDRDDRIEGVREVSGKRVAFARSTDVIEPEGKLRGQAALVLALLRAQGEQPVARLAERFGNARSAVKRLAGMGLVTLDEREADVDPFFSAPEARDVPPALTAPQAHAAQRIEEAVAGACGPDAKPRGFLLFGVTGSGKTEVYLRAIEAAFARGRGALVMVPEIALTPQLVARFRARFGDDVAVLHSALADRDRHAMWTRLRRGELRVAIGARSALFAPVPDLGLIIVDEEHDASFKQEEGVRYHARDMAILRAHRARCVLVLGSATPSLESVALARKGSLEELSLPDRAHKEASLPTITLIDIRRIGAGPTGDKLVSIPLHRALEQTLAKGEQAILFLNRRGFAPSIVCDACGALETCKSCSVSLTFHRTGPRDPSPDAPPRGRMRCHYCDFSTVLGDRCSACKAQALMLEGLGTERLESTIAEAFPAAKVARLDRDVAEGAKAQAILDRMRAGEIDVLVGTQMVTKGHDLPRVTLVGVVNADAALSMPDFRAAERGFQLLVQVAGRAGRHDLPGRVLIQTRAPEHPAIVFAMRHDVPGFLKHELADRREVGYPPYARLALLRIDAVDEDVARQAAAMLAAQARTTPEVLGRHVEVLGPAPAPIARLRGRFRFRVMLRATERKPLRAVLLVVAKARDAMDRRVRAAIDVDPVSML